jgi:hypothetical protein
MSITNARPTIWSSKILRALNTLLVYASPAVINRDYEGEVSEAGDTVKITTLGDVEVKTYTRDTNIAAPEALTDAALTLAIDQQDYFNFQVDNIDRRQANVPLMDEAARRAAYGLRKKTDTFVAELYKQIDTANVIGSDASPTHALKSEEAYNNLVELGVVLDGTDTPDDGRFAIVPPFFVGAIQKDLRFTSYGTSANRSQLEKGLPVGDNGLVGEAAGFKIYRSNQVPQTSAKKYKIVGGVPMAWSFVDQLSKVVAYEPELRFADALKGLHVYGGKVVRPSNLAVLTTNNEA